MRRNDGFTVVEVLVVIIFLAMVGGGVYLWQQRQVDEVKKSAAAVTPTPTPSSSPTPSRSIKTYNNTDYGYTFRYSDKFTLREEGSESKGGLKARVVLQLPDDAAHPERQPYKAIVITSMAPIADGIGNSPTMSTKDAFLGSGQHGSLTDVTVGGVQGFRFDGTDSSTTADGESITVLEHNGREIQISLFNDSDLKADYEQILASFEFTNQK